MPDSATARTAMETRRKRARFRAWHRGTREMDLILGNFADEALSSMGADDLHEFEQMLDLPDSELLKWFTRAVPVPDTHDTALFRRIASRHRYDRN